MDDMARDLHDALVEYLGRWDKLPERRDVDRRIFGVLDSALDLFLALMAEWEAEGTDAPDHEQVH